MAIQTADALPDAWAKAVERLNKVGAFADESGQFPSSPNLKDFEKKVRAEGYTGGQLDAGELESPKNGVSFIIFDKSKMGDVDEAVLAWDQEYRQRWRETVIDRVSDWLTRLDNLKSVVQSWLPESMSIVERPQIKMHEELMAKFKVDPALMPSFDIFEGSKPIMRVQPKGLWIIGANGRVDLITPTSSYILVDNSPPGADASNWHYYASNNNRQSTPLDQDSFTRLLK